MSQFPPTFIVSTRKERLGSLVLTVGISAVLTLGFLPTAREIGAWLPPLETAAFPLLCWLFYVSLPGREGKADLDWPLVRLLKISLVPLVVGVAFGYCRHEPSFFSRWGTIDARSWALWYLVVVPIGEELLFRGWLYKIIERLWPQRFFTATNPLPLSLVMPAIAFAIWHFQNLSQDPWRLVAFQVGYTFFAGLWLGFLRWKTSRLTFPILAHIALNLCSVLF